MKSRLDVKNKMHKNGRRAILEIEGLHICMDNAFRILKEELRSNEKTQSPSGYNLFNFKSLIC